MTVTAPRTHRGTSNADARGNTADRRARRAWLLATFGDGTTCPCAVCGVLLTEETLTVDRYPVSGRDGGTYARGNIRPACAADNSELGGRLRADRPMVIGVDPGPIPGIAVVRPDGQAELAQCSAALLEPVLRAIVGTASRRWDADGDLDQTPTPHAIVAVEKFVIGRRSSRVKTPGASAQTRNMVGALEALGAALGVPVLLRAAAEVKPWATANDSARLAAAGFVVDGMRHARSAAWHALYCAVNDAGFPDPLSRKTARS